MEIKIEKNEFMNEVSFQISVSKAFIEEQCKSSPVAHLITDEQAFGIIKDAILLSMGLEEAPATKGGE